MENGSGENRGRMALADSRDQVIQAADTAVPTQGKVRLDLPPSPCLPGSVGTSKMRYFAPSQAVWTTAKESALVTLLPSSRRACAA